MRDRVLLSLYLALVVLVTLIHLPGCLAAALAIAILLAGPRRWRLLKQAVVSVLAFNLTVSLGYAIVAGWRGEFQPQYLLLVNLRVLLLIYLGLWVAGRINIASALSFSRTLGFLATLAAGQMQGFRKLSSDFSQAFRSRSPARPRFTHRMQLAVAQGQQLLDKSVHASEEIGQAMRSRGCFDD